MPLLPRDFDEGTRQLIERVKPDTMTSPERIVALRDAVRHVVRRRISGDIVECGVWRGGSMMAVALTLLELGEHRDLHLFDTFEGMTPPTDVDVDIDGHRAGDRLSSEDRETSWVWASASVDVVEANLASIGYPSDRLHLVPGPVERTIPGGAPSVISVLRLDTDWYESTRHELEHLWPRLAHGGVLIIDDYGHWEGARRAVDEFLEQLPDAPLLCRIDYTGRMLIKGS